MEITSFTFLISVFAGIVFCNVIKSNFIRSCFLIAINSFLICSSLNHLSQAIPLIVFLLFGYILVVLQKRWRTNHFLFISISFVVFFFVFLKRYTIVSFFPVLPFDYTTIGLSYILFRLIHLLIDVNQGAIDNVPDPVSFINYMTFFLCFISGPVQRFQDFNSQTESISLKVLSQHEVMNSFSRLLTGYVKILILCPEFDQLPTNALSTYVAQFNQSGTANFSLIMSIVFISFKAVSYVGYLYFNFSGYMDVIIGVSNLCCFRLPENFDKPFQAKNFLDLWSRWHITLSEWLKFYLFNPILRFLVERVPNRLFHPYLGVLSFFLTFFVMGMWHGTTGPFVIYSLMLALGVSINKLYQIAMVSYLGKLRYQNLCNFTLYSSMAQGFTMSYFAISLICVWPRSEIFFLNFSLRQLLDLFLVFLVLGVFFGALSVLINVIGKNFPLWSTLNKRHESYLYLAFKVFLLFTSGNLWNNRIEFIYKAF